MNRAMCAAFFPSSFEESERGIRPCLQMFTACERQPALQRG
jgi:hypothetical protein